ncbi:outer membrane beta-barrel protein [Candidatus Parabeggiatoa sp. HSG14]|uniref:outer membrane protein n=1 Tax=Candidatus Parabeggiatoa sp. HSG14 TaxID=3055593 RepID=UPI0025A82BAC|nr:outer membrane beta-barrel protein [Thiotrichales bacterium HSG14]
MIDIKKTILYSVLASSLLTITTPVAYADNLFTQPANRHGKTEGYLIFQPTSGDTIGSSSSYGISSEQKTDDTTFIGLGIGVNGTKGGLNLNTEFVLGSTNILYEFSDGRGTTETAKSWDLSILGASLNADYNFLNSRLTPLLTGGIGWYYFSYDIPGGSDILFSGSEFSYSVGGGARWDITDKFFMKGLYKMTSTSSFSFNGISLNLGYIF